MRILSIVSLHPWSFEVLWGSLTDPIGVWESFQVKAKFELPDGQVKWGDKTEIELGNDFKVLEMDTVDLLDPSGQKLRRRR